LWSGEHDPDVFINEWRRNFWFDLHKKTGNSDEDKFSGGFDVQYIRERDTTTVYGKFSEKTRDDKKTEDEREVGVDFERLLGPEKRHLWYLRASWLQDQIEDLELRSIYATGYGYYFIRNNATILRGRSGLQYRIEDFYSEETRDDIGLDLGVEFKTKITDNIAWYTDLEYAPAFEDLNNYIASHESGLNIPFGVDITMTLKTGIEHNYTSQPAEDFSKLDTRYFMRLEFEF
jgi:putative salt-induced outer membrane protein YdiY